MKILAKSMVANTQIHTGKCYFLGISAQADAVYHVYNIETSGNAAAANEVGYIDKDATTTAYILPKPGVECTNGLYCLNASNACIIYYAL